MIFKPLLHPASSTCISTPGDVATRQAVMVDPSQDQTGPDVTIPKQPGLKIVCMLEIHVHTDHLIGAGVLREAPAAATGVSRRCVANVFDRLLDNGDPIRTGDETMPVISTTGRSARTNYHIWRDRMHGGPG
jgi:glyoxylase-like metal-dependent hydrolase (beta-lactamase superfamily II)